MKRSRIILGMAALCVAAFGAFAFQRSNATIDAYYIPATGGCQNADLQVECVADNQPGCLGISGDAAGKQLFEQGCETRLSPEPGF